MTDESNKDKDARKEDGFIDLNPYNNQDQLNIEDPHNFHAQSGGIPRKSILASIKDNWTTIASIAAGTLIIIAGYSTYKYFTKPAEKEGLIQETSLADVKIDEINIETPVDKTTEEDFTNIVPGDTFGIKPRKNKMAASKEKVASASSVKTPKTTNLAEESQSKTTEISTTITPETTWKANDYKPGNINGESHTVVKGDTLWEIAEAVYGNGSQWHKIADANNVENLPNGNPLIIPGQVLTLPN